MKQKKKPRINSVGLQHTRVDNNKTNKAQASRFYKNDKKGRGDWKI